MPLAREIVGGGISPVTASALGGGSNSALASLGTIQGDAAPIATTTTIVTGADGTKGVILPACGTGETVMVFNNSASTLKVWPPVGSAISVAGTGLGTANASYAHTTYANCLYTCVSATQWLANKSA